MTDLAKASNKQEKVKYWSDQAAEIAQMCPKFQRFLADYKSELEQTEFGDGICPACYLEKKQRGSIRQAPELNVENDDLVDYYVCRDCEVQYLNRA